MRWRNDALINEGDIFHRIRQIPPAYWKHDPTLYESDGYPRGKHIAKICQEMAWEKTLNTDYARLQLAKARGQVRDIRFRTQKYFDQPCQRCHEELARCQGMCNRCYHQTRREQVKA